MDQRIRGKRKINPKEDANILSQISFFYTYNLMKKGFKKELQESDIYDVIPSFESEKLGNKLELSWKIEKANHRNPSVVRTLWRCYGKQYMFLGFIQLIMKLAMSMLLPQAISKLVAFFTPKQTAISQDDAYYYAALVIGLTIINIIYSHNYMLYLTEMGIRIKTAFCSLLYRKALKLNTSSASDVTMGQIVTITTKDVLSFETAIIFANDIWIGLILAGFITYLIYEKIGIAAFSGIGFFLLVIPLQAFVGKITSNLRVESSRKTDRRIQSTKEILSAIKIIKMYTWEPIFSQIVTSARSKEMKKIKSIYYLKAVSLIIGSLVSSISFYLLIMTYKWLGNDITAEKVYFVMSCFQSLRSVITISIPLGIVQLAEMAAALRRISKVLLAEQVRKPGRITGNKDKPQILLKDVSIRIKDHYVLRHLNINITNPGLNIITGPVGSGKSTLLKIILEDLVITQGVVRVNGVVSYASQEPWVFPSTIRQNIFFGELHDQFRYEKVLEVCALNQDINSFDSGDRTLVGDRGLNLSKGQQARINLARAVYKKADIYLLDDCFSALDAHVQEFVYNECIRKFLADKIVLLVSHNEKHLKNANDVLVVENGSVLFVPNPSILINQDIPYIDRDEPTAEQCIEEIDEIHHETSELIPKMRSTRNIYAEVKKTGKVKAEVYLKYYKYAGGGIFATLLLILFISGQATVSYSDKLVSNWVNMEHNLTQYKLKNLTHTGEYLEAVERHSKIMKTYTAMIAATTVLFLVRAFYHFGLAVRASVNLHKTILVSIMNAKMSFFDSHFIGNIINRFSKDLGTIDEFLPFTIYECIRLVLFLAGVIILIATVNYMFLIPAALCFLKLYFIRRFYLPTGRSLKRLDASTRSPVVGYLNATLEGLTTIRAFQNQNILKNEYDKHQDLYTSAYYMLQCTTRAFGFSLDMVGAFFVAAVVIKFTVMDIDTEAGNVGLAITQAFMLTGLLQWALRQWAELENNMTSVERVLEYTDIEKENKSGITVPNWPDKGRILFENVYLRYPNTGYILKNINFDISPCEKVGIVGRTGAGKTSIISAIFRLYEIEGNILIDDVDIKTLSLNFLRSGIAIIPQDPTLFSGTIRDNIDPNKKYSDDEIWKALKMVKMTDVIKNLDHKASESGFHTFSSGQKQLICMARAIVCRNKIIILDEATANMDPETDRLIHSSVQEYFANCTVITIAHRLHTVLNSDRVMVVDNGEIVEFDKPRTLIADKGFFYRMVKQANLLN